MIFIFKNNTLILSISITRKTRCITGIYATIELIVFTIDYFINYILIQLKTSINQCYLSSATPIDLHFRRLIGSHKDTYHASFVSIFQNCIGIVMIAW
jgi:hypothetical protein